MSGLDVLFLETGKIICNCGYFIRKPLVYKWPSRVTGLTLFFSSYIKDFLKLGLFSQELVCFEHCFDYKSSI